MTDTKKILIIEDEQDLREMYKIKLESVGFKVITADNGDSGLKAISKEKPDIVLLDLIMTKKNGFQVLEELKKNKKNNNLAVIVLSNLGQDDDISLALELGAKDYLIKAQISLDDLVEKIQSYT